MDSFADGIRQLQETLPPKFVASASLTIVIYDNLLTLDREISTVWKAKLSTGKILFLLNRYVVLVVGTFGLLAQVLPDPSEIFCRSWYSIEIFASVFCLTVVQIILLLRTYALYKRSQFVLIALSVLCFACVGSMTIIGALFCRRLFIHENILYDFIKLSGIEKQGYGLVSLGCLKDCKDCGPLLRAFYVPMMVFDTVIFALTLASAVQHARENIHAPFLTMLYRDGFSYFAVILLTSLTNLVLWSVLKGGLTELLTHLVRGLLSVMCSRLMLNIRTTHYQHRKRHEINSMSLATYHMEELDQVTTSVETNVVASRAHETASTCRDTASPSGYSSTPSHSEFRKMWLREERRDTSTSSDLARQSKTSYQFPSRGTTPEAPLPRTRRPLSDTLSTTHRSLELVERTPQTGVHWPPTAGPSRHSAPSPAQTSSPTSSNFTNSPSPSRSNSQSRSRDVYPPSRLKSPPLDLSSAKGREIVDLELDTAGEYQQDDGHTPRAERSTDPPLDTLQRGSEEDEEDAGDEGAEGQRRLEWQREWEWKWKWKRRRS